MERQCIFRVFILGWLLCGSPWIVYGKGVSPAAKKPSLSTMIVTAVSVGLLGGTALTVGAHELSAEQQQARRQHLRQQDGRLMPLVRDGLSGSPSGMVRGWNEQLGAEEDEATNALAWSEEVTQGSGVFYLALHNPDYDHIHHLVYVGDAATGEPLFAGMFLDGHEEDYLRLYGHNGLVAQGFAQRDVKVFPDPLGLYSEVTVFTVKDLNLRGRYTPVVPELFPVAEVGEELQMVQYGVRADDPESLFDLPIKQRSCEVLNANVWAELGIGRHTCTAREGAHASFGAPIFLAVDGKLVGFYGGDTPVHANHAEGMTQEFVDFVIEQQTNPTVVDNRDKLAVTWGALKVAR